MALGAYGIVRPADVSPQDVEIILNYTPSRDVTNNFTLKKLDSASILTPYFHNANTGGNANVEILGGLYNLKLPASEFNKIGIYTLYIRPAEIRTKIEDCGILSALPSVKGIVLNLNNIPQQYRNKFTNQGMKNICGIIGVALNYRRKKIRDEVIKINKNFKKLFKVIIIVKILSIIFFF